MGLAVFGEQLAARTYARMAELRPDLAGDLREFAAMEGRHSAWFQQAAAEHDVTPDKAFADAQLGYLIEQVDGYHAAGDFEALAVLQGFIVECLAIATYEPFLEVAPRFPGTEQVFRQALEDERVHVRWITALLRERFREAGDALVALAERVNGRGVDCVGGTLLDLADCLAAIGLSGADCSARMMDEYAALLEGVGLAPAAATRSVVALFVPLIRKHRSAR